MQCAHRASTVGPRGVELGMVRIRPLAAAAGVQEGDMSVVTDATLMNGQGETVYTNFFPAPLNAAHRNLFQRRIGMNFTLETYG